VASRRPRQPNDPSIMASVEAALSTVSRPDGTESEEPALYCGLGLHRPLG